MIRVYLFPAMAAERYGLSEAGGNVRVVTSTFDSTESSPLDTVRFEEVIDRDVGNRFTSADWGCEMDAGIVDTFGEISSD